MLHIQKSSSNGNGAISSRDLEATGANVLAPTDLTDERLETIAKDIETTHNKAVLHIATRLAEARDIFCYRRDEGGFGGWVETRLRYSRSKAYNLLSIHERFGGERNLSKRLDTFPASILYLLAAPSTPAEAIDEIVERAQAGEPVTVAKVKGVVDTTKGRKQPSSQPRTESTKRERRSSQEVRLETFFHSILFVTTACTAIVEREIPDLNKKQQDEAIAQLKEASAALSIFSNRFKNDNEKTRDDIGPTSTGEIARKDAEIEELRAEKRRLEITISEFQTAIKKWEDTVEAQKNIIYDLQNENAKLQAGVAAPPDDGLNIPVCLRHAVSATPRSGHEADLSGENGRESVPVNARVAP